MEAGNKDNKDTKDKKDCKDGIFLRRRFCVPDVLVVLVSFVAGPAPAR